MSCCHMYQAEVRWHCPLSVSQWPWASSMTFSFHQSHFNSLQNCILTENVPMFCAYVNMNILYTHTQTKILIKQLYVHHILLRVWSRCDWDCSCSSWAVEPSLATASVMKQSKFGFGNTRRTRGPMISTWTRERRSDFGWQMKSLWTRRQRGRPLRRRTRRLNRDSLQRRHQRTAEKRKRHRTLWL